jgi:hypothetical protein
MAMKGLRREVTGAIVFKIVALILLWYFFFSPAHRTHVSPADMAAALAKGPPPR